MPNYVKTNLNFIGSDEDVKKIKDFVFSKVNDEDYGFDFRKIIPYPSKENCPSKYLLDEKFTTDNGYGLQNTKAHVSVMEECPYLNWYEWQCDNWGTKWNALEPYWSLNEVWFETAWSFCEPIVVALSKKFPEVTIEFKYADEDIGSNCDYGWCKNGEISYAYVNGPAKKKFAIDIWDCADDYEFKNGEWVYKEEE